MGAIAEAGNLRPRVVVAVSGGGDSMVLLHLVRDWGLGHGWEVLAVTVNHGLRPDSSIEAETVAGACASLGVTHAILRWDGSGRGNLQARARAARRRLIGTWAVERDSDLALLGHTADDQAETVLLRLARGSGVDGLAGMPEQFVAEGISWGRPLLRVPREALRAWLMARNVGWVEDPSNRDPRFDRARARAMLDRLSDLGLTRARLVRTADHMARARATLSEAARAEAGRIVREEGRDLLLPERVVRMFGTEDTTARILAAALQWVGGRETRPRWESLQRLAAVVAGGRGATLSGCRIQPEGEWVRISPEARNAAAPVRNPRLRFARTAGFD